MSGVLASIFGSCTAPQIPSSSEGKISFVPLEDRLKNAHKDMEHLKEALRMKESALQDLQRDVNYYQVKNQELTDVLNAREHSSPGRAQQVLRAKAEQNAELTLQVHALRDLLNKSTEAIDTLQKDLEKAKSEKELFIKEHNGHQRLMIAINGLSNTLERVDVSSVDIQSDWITSKWMAIQKKADTNSPHHQETKTVQFITSKIIAMEADRQRLVKESKSYQDDHSKQEEKITALERQLKAMHREEKEWKDERLALQRELDVRAGKIGALEELFQNINTNRTIDGTIPKTVDCAGEKQAVVSVMDGMYDEEEQKHEDDQATKHGEDDDSMNAFSQVAYNVGEAFSKMVDTLSVDIKSISSQMADATASSHNSQEHQDLKEEVDVCSFHTKQVEEELYIAAMEEAQEWKDKHEILSHVHDEAQLKITNLSAQVQDLKVQATNSKKKAELREGLLRDVIQQYKELQQEHTGAIEQLDRLKAKVARLLVKQCKHDHQEGQAPSPKSLEASKGQKTNPHHDNESSPQQGFLDDEASTFDMTEGSSPSEDEADQPHSSIPADEDPSTISLSIRVDKKMMEDYKRLESECDRLFHEFETSIAKISALEEELEAARGHVRDSQKAHADQARVIALLENEKVHLQEEMVEAKRRLVEATTKDEALAQEHRDELRMAELRAEQSRSKQMEREQDLWDVIEQYKKLAEQNETTKEQMTNVERELQLTHKVQIQRRDLVYEYRKMERALEHAMETVEQLEKDLKQAKAEAARNKEESKSIRKRLAGCHFHYKQLQERYNIVLKEKDELDREWSKSQKYESLRQAQTDTWKIQLQELQEQHRTSQEQVDRLTQENQALHKYSEDLLNLTSETIESI